MVMTLLLLALASAHPVGAQSGGGAEEDWQDTTEGGAETPLEVHQEIVVTADVAAPGLERLDEEELASGRHTNVGEALTEIPGVSAVRRGASATEPVIRGLGYERVVTQLGHLPLFGACPARMDPPVNYFHAQTAGAVQVALGLPSATLGPGGTGGRVVIDPDYERGPDDEAGFSGWAVAGGDDVRSGYTGGAGFQGGNAAVDFSGAVDAVRYGDYESAGGTEVPATQEGWSGRLTFGLRPRESHRWWNAVNRVQEDQVDFPSLPMNLVDSTLWTYNTGYRIDRPTGGTLRRIEISAGYAAIDHLMNNTGKPNRGMLEAESATDATTFSGLVRADLALTTSSILALGADYYDLARDGLRERYMVAPGQTFYDRIWPDTSQGDLGGFAELNMRLASSWMLRAGARLDRVESDARAVDDPSLQGRTVLENYIRFYGEEAGEVAKTETLPSANLVLQWAPLEGLEAHAGVGLATRAAGMTERYFAFAPAPGGYLLGNPALDAERKVEFDLGASWRKDRCRFFVSFFNNCVRDYILQTAIDRQDVNGDGTEDLIRGFVNTDARLYGVEAGAVHGRLEHWSFPWSVAWVHAADRESGRPLPEIPPLEGRAAARADYGKRFPWWAELGGRFVDRQTRVDETFPENETPGFAVWHLRGGVRLVGWLQLRAGIENLFDKEYHEHLTREAAMPLGGLDAGDEIPAPGRGFYVSLRGTF
jgi:iron complex outermembrane receptor protein